MNRFSEVLKRARARLEIPEPSRTRVLLEMAADLEDSFQFYVSQGLTEAEAVQRAEEAFGTSEEALKHLARIHQSGMGGIADRVTGQVGRLWEKILLILLFAFEIWLAVRVLSDRSFFVYMSPFLWPIAALASSAFVFTIWKLIQIFSTSGRNIRKLREGLGVLLFCAGSSFAVAGCGFLFHMQRFFRLNVERAPESLFMNFAGFMIQISSMMTIGLLTAILSALVWFLLAGLVARAEMRQMDSLLEIGV